MDMDPQTAAFMPRDELWRINSEMSRLQQIQQEHAERLNRVERRQDEDISRTKSLWGSQSPFPGILAGTPQQRPMEQPPSDAFSGFDDPANLIGSLHLDAEDEPRRVGATSRANSVRFDESANQGHWAHPSRVSLDLLPRSGSSLGSHPMIERTYSHKSDGRQSSTAQSVHSATSRANSLGIDTSNALSGAGLSINPGLYVLGSCPAIVRCWLTTNFKHDTLLYAAMCTGSYASTITLKMVKKLGFSDEIERDEAGLQNIKINLYLPEATVRTASIRSSSPESQLPSIAVKFTIVTGEIDENDKGIEVIIGSDILRTHNADILFSSNTLIIYDDERSKLSVPLVRPEDESIFKKLRTSSALIGLSESTASSGLSSTNGNEAPKAAQMQDHSLKSPESPKPSAPSLSPSVTASIGAKEDSRISVDSSRPPFSILSTTREPADLGEISSPSSKVGPSPAIWNSWRRDPDKPAPASTNDSSWVKTSTNYQRREQGIKVLRPLKASTRSFSTTQSASSPSGSHSQSRFFEDGKRRMDGDGFEGGSVKRNGSGATSISGSAKDGSIGRLNGNANPVGGGTAFSWLSK